jgi:hypothetical protein
VPSSWAAVPCAYLRFSPSYEAQLAEAHARRWPVAELPGGHLHQLVRPHQAAEGILAEFPG